MKQTFTVTVEGFAAGSDVAGAIRSQLEEHNGTPSWSVSVAPHGDPESEIHDGPLVSILLPNYNYGHRVERMLRSIRAQTVQDVELVVVDDGSDDDSIARIRPFLEARDRLVIHGKNQGAAAAINTAARFATGEYMTWVSSDNEMTPGWLEKLLAAMGRDVGVAYANYDRFNDDGPQPGVWGKPYDPARLLQDQNCYIGPAFLIRADVWHETGELRGKNSCDYDHWLRIEEACTGRGLKFRYSPEILCHYYAGAERSTVARPNDYDAGVWQREARSRRARKSLLGSIPKPQSEIASKVVTS